MEGQERRGSIPHISALDGARGVAVAGVLLFHGGHLLGGYLGVDLFFTLSGFLITSLLLAESGRAGNVGLGGFWARRARRLLPALAVLMVGVALYSAILATPQELAQIRGDAFATLAYAANWRAVFSHQNYFALFTAPSPLQHTWSLAIEEQFYLVWPLVFVALLARFKRATPKAVLVTSLALAAISAVLMIALYSPTNTARLYYGTDTRAAAILLGAALAAWLTIHGPTTNHTTRVAIEAAGIVGAIVLAIAWARLDGQSATLYRGGFLACGLAATAIIATITHPEPLVLSRALTWKPLCALGLISYAVYLYHWPIDIILNQQRTNLSGWTLLGFQTAVTLAAAIASYKLVEQPIRHGALSAAQWQKLTPAIAIALVAAIVFSTNGAIKVLGPVATPAALRDPLAAATHAYAVAAPGSRRIMIVGNSVAWFLAPAFEHVRATPQLAVFNAGLPGCNALPDITLMRLKGSQGASLTQQTFPCDPSWEAGAITRFRPDIVMWIVSNPADRLLYRGEWVRPCTKRYDALYVANLKHQITTLGAGGAHVVVVTAAYPRFFGGADENGPTDCDNALRRQVAAANGAQLVDLNAYICPNGQCRTKQNGVTLRPDGEHYTGAGGEIVAQWLIDQVGSRT